MALVVAKEGNIDVVTASKTRVKNLFSNGTKVYLTFSGGKDSLCIANVVYDLILKGEINPKQLEVVFIDEEAIFPCVERIVKEWRKKFMLTGAKFVWFALEVKHFCCFNQLACDETFICWDRYKKDVWVRTPPPYAVFEHPLLRPRIESYQEFMTKYTIDGICIIGVRTAESIQRRQNIASTKSFITNENKVFPIYDWSNDDVWKYLYECKVDIPEIYLYLYQIGESKKRLRVSQFFSSDTANILVRMNEYYPDLMNRVIKREPNAYLASLYWDSEIFGRTTRARRKLETDEKINSVDYKKKLLEVFNPKTMRKTFDTQFAYDNAVKYKYAYLKYGLLMDNDMCRKLYEGLMSGDPKQRTLRAVTMSVLSKYNSANVKAKNNGGIKHG